MKKIFAGTDKTISGREKRNSALAREIAAEGITVLKNDGVLPVTEKKIALFGSGARGTVNGGTGSGSVKGRYSVSIEQGLLAAGFEITTKGWLDRCEKHYNDAYSAWRAAREAEVEGVSDILQILAKVNQTPFVYLTGVPVTEEDIANAGTGVAIYVISRQAGEGYDRSKGEGDYLPDATELTNIRRLTESFPDVIVVINAGGQVNASAFEALGVKGLIFYGQAGQEGGNAFADIVSGKVSLSGKLAVSWAKAYEDIPYGENYGAGGDALAQDYAEDIYVGYRYYDTFCVKPAYPFGFGLSYTEFEISVSESAYSEEKFTVRGNVKNAGKCAGREVVQVYVALPYGKAGAEAKRLAAFCKTPLLQPGEETAFRVDFPLDTLARYEEETASFVLEEGIYTVLAGNSSEHVQGVCNIRFPQAVVLEQCRNVCAVQKTFPVLKAPERSGEEGMNLPEIVVDAANIRTKTHGYGARQETFLPEVQQLVGQMGTEELAALVVGGGVKEGSVVTALGASGFTTGSLYETYGIPNLVMADGPSGLNLMGEFSVDDKGNSMAVAIPPAYDFGMFGKYMRDSIAKNSGSGVRHYQYATAMPSPSILAQTWNTDLWEHFGTAIGVEMEEMGISVWLAPGMNIQKNPLCGRNFEYFSEDPVVSGKAAAAVIRGVQSVKGKSVAVKHFCCNNAEYERNHSSSNLTERALREIYLRGFRIAVEEGQPLAVMSSYNKVNGVYAANSRDLLSDILRHEWGFGGLVMTDWNSCGAGKADVIKAISAENDLIMPGTDEEVRKIAGAVRSGELETERLRISASRVLELVAKTAAVPFGKGCV